MDETGILVNIIEKIAQEFNRRGFQLYEVGGHVRDSIMGQPSNDVDLTTNATPEITEEILHSIIENQNGSIYTLGKEYGTICIESPSIGTIEITTFRKEVYPTSSRKPNVVFGQNLIEDLARRDFTINSIARNLSTNEIIDPFHGVEDVNNKLIRCVGSDDRLEEDPLRMMRGIRFASQFNFNVAFTITHPERLQIISNERIREELSKMILSPNPVFAMHQLVSTKLMNYIIPEYNALIGMNQGKYHIKDVYEHSLLVLEKTTQFDFKENNLIFRLSALLHDIGKPNTISNNNGEIHFYDHQNVGAKIATNILKRLTYDSDSIDTVGIMIKNHMAMLMLSEEDINRRNAIRIIRRLVNQDNIHMLLALVFCDTRSAASPNAKRLEKLKSAVEDALSYNPITITSPIDGKEIMNQFHLSPGKLIGEIKEYLTEMVISGSLDQNDKSTAIILAEKYLGGKSCQ